ncbi:non-canonical ubiquitin conjugating enzyme 1 [Lyophyllum atratum]|nr:non-canonical ubiquitin conjugating enzyme 1 [Lyophyllum atratum]
MAAKSLNKNNSAVKRIMQEAKELANDPSTDYSAAPLEDDIFEWHCTLRGPAGTDFEGGLYHFRILLPAEYPFRPPSLMMLTPNGRFELNTKICISFTSYHEELWQPAWGVRTAIIGLQGFFPLKGQNAVGIGSIEYPSGERKRLAALSREWVCPHCNESNLALLPDPPATAEGTAASGAAISGFLSPGHTLSERSEEAPPAHSPADVTPDPEIATMHSIETLLPSGASTAAGPIHARPPSFLTRPALETPDVPATPVVSEVRRRTRKPPLLLVDGAICVLFMIAFAIICRRII